MNTCLIKSSVTSRTMPHVIRSCQKGTNPTPECISAHDGRHRRGVLHASRRVRALDPLLGLALGLRPDTRKQKSERGVSRSSCGKSRIVGMNPKQQHADK